MLLRSYASRITAAAALTLFGLACPAAHAQEVNLTGKWKADDRGTYYIRQIGNEVWWEGRSEERGKEWSNVFHGEIKGKHIIGKWADVPRGEARGSGTLHLEMHFRDGNVVELRKAKEVGDGFGGGTWTR
jgi:hypothetical protein